MAPKLAPTESRTARLSRLVGEKYEKEAACAAAKAQLATLRAEGAAIQREIDQITLELEEIEGRAGSRRRRSAAPESAAPVATDEELPFPDGSDEPAAEVSQGRIRFVIPASATLKGRVLAVLRETGAAMSAAQVAGALGGGTTEKSVFFTLQSIRQRQPDVLTKPDRGLWQLKKEDAS